MASGVVSGGPLAPVFLSASVPDPRRDPIYCSTARPARISEAVSMLARVVLSRGTLVFGGHPAISPLVLAVARQLCAVDRVEIFQSEFFRATVPPDSIAFPRLVWTRELAGDRDASLQEMRERMMREYVFGAGFFIGGMDGVEDEHAMFRALQPDVPTFPVGSTGGAALALLNKGEGPGDPTQQYMLRNDLVYAYLIERLLGLAP